MSWIKKTTVSIIAALTLVSAGTYIYFHIRASPEKASDIERMRPALDSATNDALVEVRDRSGTELVRLEHQDVRTNVLVNEHDGYMAPVPVDWELDSSNYRFVTVLFGDDFKLNLFMQDIDLSYDSPEIYINYTLSNVREGYGPIDHKTDRQEDIGPYRVATTSWTREPITTIRNDLDCYIMENIILDDRTVMSFLLKSTEETIDLYGLEVHEMIEGLTFIDADGTEVRPEQPRKETSDIELVGKELSVSIPEDGMVFGIFHKPHNDHRAELLDLEERLDFRFELIMDYFSLDVPFNERADFIRYQYDDGRVMLITLQPFVGSRADGHDGSVVIRRIANGEFDQAILDWATGLKELGGPVFLRFANEMNGDWVEWCSWFYGLDPDIYIYAWARVRTIFKEAGADNVIFVWNPHDRTYPDYDWNSQYLYYPGDSKVDWIGLTAYNNGATLPNEIWRDFSECYRTLYSEYMARFSDKPFMITEFACNEIGGDKPGWILEGLDSLTRDYPNIRAAVWWNGVDETWIYDIDSTYGSLDAFRTAISDPYFQKDPVRGI